MSPLLHWPSSTAAPDAPVEGAPDGEVLATRTYQPLELFLFSAAGWHPHRIHYDHPYATGVEGHDAVVVHGPLQAVHVLDALIAALDVPVVVRTLSYRHLALLTVGQGAVVKGRLASVGVDGSSATFEAWMERAVDGERTTTMTATVERAPAGTATAGTATAGTATSAGRAAGEGAA